MRRAAFQAHKRPFAAIALVGLYASRDVQAYVSPPAVRPHNCLRPSAPAQHAHQVASVIKGERRVCMRATDERGGDPLDTKQALAVKSFATLREELRLKLEGLFGSMSAWMDQPDEGGVDAASVLSRYKGGAARSTTKVPRNGVLETISLNTVTNKDCISDPPPAITATIAAGPIAPTLIQPQPKADAALGKAADPVNENIARISDRVPNAWLAVCHSASLKKKELKKIIVDEKPICLFRTSTGEVKAISDICLHRAAALSDGALDSQDLVVCPYHAYKFDGDGRLRYIPGVDETLLAKSKRSARTVWYKTAEQGGLVYIFPDAMRAGAIEQHVKPFLLPEEVDPTFRAVEGTTEIRSPANLVVENLLDMLHISYVHTFGNMQEPLPFEEKYDLMFDDEGPQLLPYARTTFKYRAGPNSISKVIGKVQEVVVENEFHIPYTTVTRVKFGNDIKTVYVVAVPVNENLTVVHYKLYRNFMYIHPKDKSWFNMAMDQFFQSVMRMTLNEDKDILESLYNEHQAGYVLSRYDKPLKQYRKTMKQFAEATKAREVIAERRTLEMELLRLIESTNRGRSATRGQHKTIMQIIFALERGFLSQFQSAESPESVMIEDSAVNGSWHLVYANPGNLSAPSARWLSSSSPPQQQLQSIPIPAKVSGRRDADDAMVHTSTSDSNLQRRLKTAGAERYLLDFKAKGRPLWLDTEQSMQTIDTSKSMLSNTAVYEGLLGIKTKVELNGVFNKVGPNRKDVQFKSANVDLGGFKVTFPHMDIFGISGWLDTTFVDEHIRICRGNRGSVFVLTRRPLAPVV